MAENRSQQQKDLHINKPEWLKTKIPRGSTLFRIKKDLRSKRLFTVCEEAKCPNISECWSYNTATFMILGDTCTRTCRFCHIKTGNPGGLVDEMEPRNTAETVRLMNLKYVVLTMVDRDDLSDGGASHCAAVMKEIRRESPGVKIEFLGGDFKGDEFALATILDGEPEVFAHNLETVRRLTPRVRDGRSSYDQSLEVLNKMKKISKTPILTKSSLMLGLGESRKEVEETLGDMRSAGVDLVTIGQYMRPTKKHLSIKEWITPEDFAYYQTLGTDLGFLHVVSGPLVRSSYRADEGYDKAMKSRESEHGQ